MFQPTDKSTTSNETTNICHIYVMTNYCSRPKHGFMEVPLQMHVTVLSDSDFITKYIVLEENT